MDKVKKDAISAVKNCVAYHVADTVKEVLMELGMGEESFTYDTTEGRNWIRLDFKSDIATGPSKKKRRAFVIKFTESLIAGD